MPKYRNRTKKPAAPYGKGKKGQNTPKEDKRESEGNDTSDNAVDEQGEDLKCDICSSSVERLVQCDRCLTWYCCGCANIPEQLQVVLSEFIELHWFCSGCDQKAIDAIRSFNDDSDPITNIKSSFTKAINTAMKSFQEALQEVIKNFQNTIHTTLTANPSESTSMDTESPILTPGLLSRHEPLTVQDVSQAVSSCMSEEKEKQKRKLNLIVHNLPESTLDEGQQRKSDDICKTTDIFKEVLQVNSKVTNAVRIGKKGDKMRLLKITVETEKDKANILRNAIKLRSDSLPEYRRKIFITPDMTPRERDENKALRAKLSELNKSGNIYKIKNGKIVQRLQ